MSIYILIIKMLLFFMSGCMGALDLHFRDLVVGDMMLYVLIVLTLNGFTKEKATSKCNCRNANGNRTTFSSFSVKSKNKIIENIF